MESSPLNFTLPPISPEQTHIINHLKESHLQVDSVAGSGKTTTNLYIAQKSPERSILLLTYNSKLRLETREKAIALGLKNLEVHTYHSFCVKYFKSLCHNDSHMIKLLNSRTEFNLPLRFDTIILDESQDLVPLYVKLIFMILAKVKASANSRICILGDKHQCIYQYNCADQRYLLMAYQFFKFKSLHECEIPWTSVKLSQSFRLSRQTAEFVNRCMLHEQRIQACKDGPKVKYVFCNAWNNSLDEMRPDSAIFQFSECLKQGYKYSDIFVLAPSVKGQKAPCRKFANLLTQYDIPIYVPNLEDENIDQKLLLNKVVFSSFHQAKGLERKVVIVYGFDNSYFQYYKRKINPMVCPNELYVAVTRALDQLILIHHSSNEFLPFLDQSQLALTAEIIGQKNPTSLSQSNYQYRSSVTELVRHLPCEVLDKAMSYVEVEEVQGEGEFIEVPVHVRQKEIYYEDVSDINGIAIPSVLELEYSRRSSGGRWSQTQRRSNLIERTLAFMKREGRGDEIGIEELLKRANFWNSEKSGYNFKLRQITRYDWLSRSNLDRCVSRLKSHISGKADFEVEIRHQGDNELLFRELKGFIDCWDGYNVWEFKCVNNLSMEHKLQLAIYMYLFEARWHVHRKKIAKDRKLDSGVGKKYGKWVWRTHVKMNYLLLNVLSNQIVRLKASLRNLREMIRVVCEYKFGDRKEESDEEFVERNRKLDIY